MNVLQTLEHIADPLHYGTIGGIWTKLIWFVFELILSGMSITGFLMWGTRTVKAARRDNLDTPEGSAVAPVTSKADSSILIQQEAK